MANPINPYVAGNPVGDSSAFIGRADVLREVLHVLRRPQDNAIVLYGQRRIGKTSILQHLAAWLPRKGSYRTVYFDLQDKAAWPLGHVLQDLARTIAHALGQPDPDLGADPETAFCQTWLSDVLSKLPAGRALVLLLDEFDVLADPKAEQAATAFFPYLRGLFESEPTRLKFVFVIGRNVNDLPSNTLSLFKGLPAQRVSLLSREDTVDLVHLAQKNKTLKWPKGAVERVWQLTHGHAFLTQELCSHVWERAYDVEPNMPPTVTIAEVEAIIPAALDASRNTLEWLWDGLPPAERVVISALAEAGPGPIAQDELEHVLRESGVRLLIRELQNAPQLLQDWDLIEPADSGYCFRVELLRRWIVEHKPLRRVQDELDRIQPRAEALYQLGLGSSKDGQMNEAVTELRRALTFNPNHTKANQLLVEILLSLGQAVEARQLLERLYEYQPAAARPRLVQVLLAQAQATESDDERLALYEQVLNLDRAQPEAIAGQRRVWRQRGDIALKSGDLGAALMAYQKAGLTDKAVEIEREIRLHELTAHLQELDKLEQSKQYQGALTLVQQLTADYSELRDWAADLDRLESRTRLADLYQRGLGALQSGDRKMAKTLLAQVVAIEPEYEEATRYLHLAVTGVDAAKLRAQLDAEKKVRQQVEATAKKESEAQSRREQELQTQLEAEKKARQQAEATAKKESEAQLEKIRQQVDAYIKKKTRQQSEQEIQKLQGQLEAEKKARQEAEAIARKRGGTGQDQLAEPFLVAPLLDSSSEPTIIGGRAVEPSPPPPPKEAPPEKKGPSCWVWGCGSLLLVSFIVIIVVVVWNNVFAPTRIAVSPAPACATRGQSWTRPQDSAEMVCVPAGPFLMGSADSDKDASSDEKPQHTVALDEFWIDKTEVTNAQYKKCVQAGACKASRYASDSEYNNDGQPVVGVDWNDANTYCRWVGGALPTEAQWEKVARGTDGQIYPWGNQPATCGYAVMYDSNGSGCGKNAPWPVGSKSRGASPYSALDMAGNVWEWVADWYDAKYYASSPSKNPSGPSSGQHRVLRGGSFGSGAVNLRGAFRSWSPPDLWGRSQGFRCVAFP